jgi:hypothetical protein
LRDTYQVAPVEVGAALVVGELVGVLLALVGEALVGAALDDADVVDVVEVGAVEVVGAVVGAVGVAASAMAKSSTVRAPTDCRLSPKLSRAASLGTAAVVYRLCAQVELFATVGPLNQNTHEPVLLLRYQPTHCTLPDALYQPLSEYW